MPEASTLFEQPDLYFGELRCAPDDDTWGEDAVVTHPIVALPCRPTWVVRGNGERYLANPNHVVIHQAGDEYRRERFEGRGYRCLFIFPTPSVIREIAAEFDPVAGAVENGDSYRLPAGIAAIDAATFSLSRRVARYSTEEPSPDGMRIAEAVYRILRAVVAATYGERRSATLREARSATRRAHAAIVEDAKEAVTTRFRERLTVDGVANAVHASPYHLTRVFRRLTGFSLHEYVNQLRLRAAFERIRDGHQDLASLATELGFSNHSHLTSNFRRAFGHTPSMVRSGHAFGPRNAAAGHSRAKRARI
jgi:AraC family transcriptional regulator